MHWLLDFAVIWLSICILIVATAWYATVVIKPRYPDWWRRVVADDDEADFRLIHKRVRR